MKNGEQVLRYIQDMKRQGYRVYSGYENGKLYFRIEKAGVRQ